MSYTSFVLQGEENFICPTHHLSYRKEKTSFVLHIICPTERKYHNWSYTSFFLYFNCTLHINCPYRERLTSFVLQLDCTLDYLSYRDGIQWYVLQRWDTMICPTEMGYNDFSYRDGIQWFGLHRWDTMICPTQMGYNDLSYRDGIQWFVLQRWDTIICPTEMGYNDLSYYWYDNMCSIIMFKKLNFISFNMLNNMLPSHLILFLSPWWRQFVGQAPRLGWARARALRPLKCWIMCCLSPYFGLELGTFQLFQSVSLTVYFNCFKIKSQEAVSVEEHILLSINRQVKYIYSS